MSRLLTPTKITAWLDCAHYLTLTNAAENGQLSGERSGLGSMAQLLLDKGAAHERECLEFYREQGLSVFEVPQRESRESFEAWVGRVGSPFADGHDVIFQMPFIHDGIRGIADFLIQVVCPATGDVSYEPVDAKLARAAAKPAHVLQLCFYADALEATTSQPCKNVHVWLGSGAIETLVVKEFRPYWNRLKGQLRTLLAAGHQASSTEPEPCTHCEFCEFSGVCEDVWRAEDSLFYVAGIKANDRKALIADDVATLADLAAIDQEVDGIRDDRLRRLVDQASLQIQTRESESSVPPFALIEAGEDSVWGRGFEQLPAPDAGDVFLDFEGHPFWRPDVGLFFLLGLIAKNGAGDWEYTAFWAHNLAEEAEAVSDLVSFLSARRNVHPGMHVYHYNHTERSALERMAADHGVVEAELTGLVETGLFVDLLLVARNGLQAGVESYGLKDLELLAEFTRGGNVDGGSGAVIEYESFMSSADEVSLERIAAYNEDDVRATRALRDWIIEQRPSGIGWRAVMLEPEEPKEELEAQVAALYAFDADSAEHLLGHLLGYWVREYKAFAAPKLAKLGEDSDSLLDVADALWTTAEKVTH